jgi:hypothetical protein
VAAWDEILVNGRQQNTANKEDRSLACESAGKLMLARAYG